MSPVHVGASFVLHAANLFRGTGVRLSPSKTLKYFLPMPAASLSGLCAVRGGFFQEPFVYAQYCPAFVHQLGCAYMDDYRACASSLRQRADCRNLFAMQNHFLLANCFRIRYNIVRYPIAYCEWTLQPGEVLKLVKRRPC